MRRELKMLLSAVAVSIPSLCFSVIGETFSLQAAKPKELLVSFEKDATASEKEQIIASQGGFIVKHFKTNNSALVRIPEFIGFMSAKESLQKIDGINQVAPNRIFYLQATTANDPKVNSQYHHKTVKSLEAWDISVGDKDVLVGIIDTGLTLNHEDLKDNLWKNPGEVGLDEEGNDKSTNGIDDDGNGYIDDFQGWDFIDNDNIPNDAHGHGTHCAGLVGATGNNGVGVSGINWNVSIVGLKIFGSSGSTTESAIIEAIEYANMMNVKITNNSWGGPARGNWGEGGQDLIYEAIRKGGEKNHLFVFAAGNSSQNSDKNPMIPGAYNLDAILNVASTTSSDSKSGFSNYGLDSVDIGAPGSSILSTVKSGFFRRKYSKMSGTSMAAPIVAGAAALVQAVYPDFTGIEIKERIMSTVDIIPALEGRTVTGGRLNVLNAISK